MADEKKPKKTPEEKAAEAEKKRVKKLAEAEKKLPEIEAAIEKANNKIKELRLKKLEIIEEIEKLKK